jgi:hypothetical protein
MAQISFAQCRHPTMSACRQGVSPQASMTTRLVGGIILATLSLEDPPTMRRRRPKPHTLLHVTVRDRVPVTERIPVHEPERTLPGERYMLAIRTDLAGRRFAEVVPREVR